MSKDENEKAIQTMAYVEMRKVSIRRKLHEVYLEYYDALCDELNGTYWMPYSGLRSIEEQLSLYNKGRTQESLAKGERIVTNARPGFSPHNWGCATDWVENKPYFDGSDMWKKSDWVGFGSAARRVGLIWGGDFKNIVDKPHVELPLKCSWAEIGKIYMASGKIVATEAILQNALYYKF